MAMVDYATAPEEQSVHLLINTNKDYADEFDYPVVSIFNKKIKNILMLMMVSYDTGLFHMNRHDNRVMEISFGTNENLSFSEEEIMILFESAQELTAEQYQYAKIFLGEVACVNILDHMIDHYMYVLTTSKHTSDNSYINIQDMPMLQQLRDMVAAHVG